MYIALAISNFGNFSSNEYVMWISDNRYFGTNYDGDDWTQFAVNDYTEVCDGSRIVFDSCSRLYDDDPYYHDDRVSVTIDPNGIFLRTRENYYRPTYKIYSCTQGSTSGYHIEILNTLGTCGYLQIKASCPSYGSPHYRYCETSIKAKYYVKKPDVSKDPSTVANKNAAALLCYDQSRYLFGSSRWCLINSGYNRNVSHFCSSPNIYNGNGGPCPEHATCSGGKYYCNRGYKDAFALNQYIIHPGDCTAVSAPKGCIPDTTSYPTNAATTTELTVTYNISNSFSNTENGLAYSLGNICGKKVTIDGCGSDDKFGDQFIEIFGFSSSSSVFRLGFGDDFQLNSMRQYYYQYYGSDFPIIGNAYIECTRFQISYPNSQYCSDAVMKLGCVGSHPCGGTVKVFIGKEKCDPGTYSTSGFKPCLVCPSGTTNSSQSDEIFPNCDLCTTNHVGRDNRVPCVPCPRGYTADENFEGTCSQCSTELLPKLKNINMYAYSNCLYDLLEQSKERLQQCIEETRYEMPSFLPTAKPSRRSKSRKPTTSNC